MHDSTKLFWVADIGGTNCRIAQIADSTLEESYSCPTKDIRTSMDLLDICQEHLSAKHCDGVAIAIAGAIHADCAKLTNADCTIDASFLSKKLGTRVLLLNDFAAQAFATFSPLGKQAKILQQGNPLPFGQRAVLGAGTGLGCASIVFSDKKWHVTSAEGGHMPFPFTEEEQCFQNFLTRTLQTDLPTCEDILGGKGLTLLHRYLTGKTCKPSFIGKHFLQRESPTLLSYACFYGRFCKMWILASACMGGLWIGGGIAHANPLILTCDTFQEELAPKDQYPWISSVPIAAFTDSNPGLFGAAQALLMS